MSQRNIKLTVAYDGSGYHGWQRQQDGIITVQGILENTISRVVKHPVSIRGSGRTDTGVHAARQVANFFSDTPIPQDKLPHALNSRLPRDIRVSKAEWVADDFDAIRSCKSKLYRYTVYNHSTFPPEANRYCYHYYHSCDIEPMQRAAALLLGQRDFASFASTSKHERLTTVRTMLRCQPWRKYHWLYFDLEATGFLYHMVRNVVGTLLEIGRGHWQPERICEILNAQDRCAAGPTVPPNGLSLQWVRY